MTLVELNRQFLSVASIEKGFTRETIRTFRSRINSFADWIGEGSTLADWNAPNLKRYFYHLVGQNLRPRTTKGYVNALRSFGSWLVECGAMQDNPALDMPMPKLDPVQRELVDDNSVSALIDACDRMRDTRRASLCRAIVATFAYSGLRREECLSIQVGDIDLAERRLVVRCGKGGKARQVWLNAECVAALREWLKARGECKHSYLFAYDSNRRIHALGLRKVYEELTAIAGLDRVPKSHDLRHNFARRSLKNGMEINILSRMLGHTSLRTTEQYLMYDEKRMREAADLTALSPSRTATQGASAPTVDRDAERRKARLRVIQRR